MVPLPEKKEVAEEPNSIQKMVGRGSPEIIYRTIRNYLHKSGFNFLVTKSIPFLTQQQKENRVMWCEQHM